MNPGGKSMSDKTRRRLLIGLGGLAVLAVLVVGGTYLYINVLSDDAPEPLALSTDTPTASANGTPAGEDTAGPVDLAGTWTVVEGSQAGYRVDEVLNGQDNTVVGRTDDVTGEVTVTDGAATDAEVVVDMTTVTTDSGSRDGQFRGPIMLTDEFPTSTFRLTEPVPLDGLDGTGQVSLTAMGELTIRDVTQPVEAQLDLQLSDENTVEIAGSVPIVFENFEIEPPNLGFVRVEDEGIVEFLLTLSRDA